MASKDVHIHYQFIFSIFKSIFNIDLKGIRVGEHDLKKDQVRSVIHLNSVMPRTARQASAVTPHKTLALKRCSLYLKYSSGVHIFIKQTKHTNNGKMVKWRNLVTIFDKAKQHFGVQKVFFCYSLKCFFCTYGMKSGQNKQTLH